MNSYGYAYCSERNDVDLDLQLDALQRVGCSRVFIDDAAAVARTELNSALAALQPGDQLVVESLARVAPNHHQLLQTFQAVRAKGAHLVSLSDHLNTSRRPGNVYPIIDALVRFDQAITERNQPRARGRAGGRKALDDKVRQLIAAHHDDPNLVVADFCARLGISRATFYKYSNLIRSDKRA